MAFKPVRLTDPKGKLDDVIASHPVDYNNFLFRDGYQVAEDQSNLDGKDDAVASEQVDETPTARRARAKADATRAAQSDASTGEGTATDAQGNTVQTS